MDGASLGDLGTDAAGRGAGVVAADVSQGSVALTVLIISLVAATGLGLGSIRVRGLRWGFLG